MSVLLVAGTTCTRLLNWFDVSLLTMTAGRVFLISEPMDGSKFTHQISPRFMVDVAHKIFRPIQGVALAALILAHGSVALSNGRIDNVGTGKAVQKMTNPSCPYFGIEPLVNLF